jgi:predicted lysophospholipase L1 biosynthesis ABC-type transport system permease subunit
VEEKEIHDELASIRSLMERSSKFISLSGLSGVLAGVYALTGAALAYQIIYSGTLRVYTTRNMHTEQNSLYELIAIAFMVLILSLVSGVVLTMNKAKKKHQQIWSKTSQALLFNMATPLVAGGILILILLFRSYYGIVSPA